MALQQVPSGIQAVGPLPWGTHFCQFYQTRDDLVETLIPYFVSGLRNRERCLWVTSEPLPAEDAKSLMVRALPEFGECLRRGQIEVRDYQDWYRGSSPPDAEGVLAAWVEREKHALADGYEGLRLTGNTFWLERSDWEGFVEYEEKVNRAFNRFRLVALCTYCLDRCSAHDIIDVVRHHEFALLRRQGSWELIESSSLALAKEELRQVNEELEARVRQRTAALEQALHGRDEFIAILSHELRNPLAPIQNSVELLRLRPQDPGVVSRATETIARQTRHLAHLVDDLLEVSRLTRGRVQLRRERLDLAALVRQAVEDRRARFEAAALALTASTPEAPVWIDGDATRLTQVLGNLLENALKFTQPGGRVSVELKTGFTTRSLRSLETQRHGERQEQDQTVSQDLLRVSSDASASSEAGGEKSAFAILTVSDTGVGIEPELLDRLFEVFVQADRSLDRSGGGLGLGLPVARGLVEQHGGSIRATSEGPGRGAEFVIHLPLAEAR